MDKETDQSYGAWIRERRMSRGLSLKQASLDTRIDEQYLRALEAGNIALLPEPYMRAFLKTYASYLGLDQGEAIQRLEVFLKDQSDRLEKVRGSTKDREGKRKHGGAAITTDIERSTSESGEDAEVNGEFSKRSGMLLSAGVIVAFAAIVYFAVYFTNSSSDMNGGSNVDPLQIQPQVEAVDSEGYTPLQPPSTTAEEDSTAIMDTQPAVEYPHYYVLEAEALEETWMEAVADGRMMISRIIEAGNFIQVAFDDTLELRLGKNRGMMLLLNGEEITDLGAPGMVLRLVMTGEGVISRRLTYPPETTPSFLNIPPRL